jgi:hypothetical protein
LSQNISQERAAIKFLSENKNSELIGLTNKKNLIFRLNKEDYKISSIKGKTFSGYHILAYYYVSWALAIPEMLSQLQLPYDDEYKLALTMHKPNK